MMSTGFVYFLQSGNTDNYKIGLTNNLDRRLKELNSGQAPYPITLQWSIAVNDTHAAERELHDRFSQNRRHGEWFEFEDSELSGVKQAYAETAGRYPNLPVFNAPIEIPQYAPEYYPQSSPPDIRSLGGDDSGIPWIGLIVAGAMAAWMSGYVKINPTKPKIWALPNGPSITLPSIPDIKIPKLPNFKIPPIEQPARTIVIAQRANVRSTPSIKGTILCQVEQNEVLESNGSEVGWGKVVACKGKSGYVHNNMISKSKRN